ncbi:lysozyme inhibitor LprI family protein [Phaeobacter piscinae]|uniref:lysozyme inhibitor LprI family protein n=1 Tax=Phaeobacter piscinae TaxID=1580596 RepID=UPI0039F6D84A
MRKYLLSALLALPLPALADPAMECSDTGSQIALRDCLKGDQICANAALSQALGYAREAAADLDDTTGRQSAGPALEAAQQSWEAFRDAHCDFVGATFGGGSGTGIAILSCRISLTRGRVEALMDHAG